VEKNRPELVVDHAAIAVNLARLSSAMSRSSAICFAIFDQNLRFRAVNQVLAATHGVSAEEHIGADMQDTCGELALQAAPALQQVLQTDRESYFESLGKLPNRTFTGCWVSHFFPLELPRGRGRQVGVLAVEVTDLRRIDELYTNLSRQLPPADNQLALSRELHHTIAEYKIALGMNLASVSHSVRDPERGVDTFTQTMRLLDQRIQALISALASCFPLGREQ
jgi:hypothetical protein